jgi:hypothetical protein
VKLYREIFFMHNGPWPCHFCGQPVTYVEVDVHHLDGNKRNNDLSNLVASHERCHMSYHAKMPNGPHSVETKSKISNALRCHKRTEEHGRNISRGKKLHMTPELKAHLKSIRRLSSGHHVPHTEEAKRKMSELAIERRTKSCPK